jgi:molybdenum cofactor biosynthesis enzyme MoaA
MSSKVIAIDDFDRSNPFQIIWNIGIRCNYDCSYCPSFRHNNSNPYNSLDDLKNTVDFIEKYTNLIKSNIDDSYRIPFSLNLTGGEPTANPNIVNLIDYISERMPDMIVTVTSNGACSKEVLDAIAKRVKTITISYHAEASQVLKQQVISNIFQLKEYKTNPEYEFQGGSVNVMMHEDPDLFDECTKLMETLKEANIFARARSIDRADQFQAANRKSKTNKKVINLDKSSRMGPAIGKRYTDTQLSQLKSEWEKINNGINAPKKEIVNVELINTSKRSHEVSGRACCSQRVMGLGYEEDLEILRDPERMKLKKNWTATKFINNRQFENWFCLVNAFWLEIEQDADEVYYHQTCKATFNKERGPIGNISNYQSILDNLSNNFNNGEFEAIICPNGRCGCGICSPKTSDKQIYENFFKRMFPNLKPKYPNLEETLKRSETIWRKQRYKEVISREDGNDNSN